MPKTKSQASYEVENTPAVIAKEIRKAPAGSRFYVKTEVPLWIKGKDSYLPLSGYIRSTRKAMLEFLADLQDTAEHQEETRGCEIVIRLSIRGACHFL